MAVPSFASGTDTRWTISAIARFARACAGIVVALLGPMAARADQVYLLNDHPEAARTALDLIENTRHEYFQAHYAVGDDAVGLTNLAKLGEAAARGKDVRLILDGQGIHVPDEVLHALKLQGVKIRIYHPLNAQTASVRTVNQRSHDKIVIQDGKYLLATSRNRDNSYFGLGSTPRVEREMVVQGRSTSEARKFFLALWESEEVSSYTPSGPMTDEKLKAVSAVLDRHSRASRRILQTPSVFSRDRSSEWLQVPETHFISDPVGPKGSQGGTSDHILDMIRRAKKNILLETPYFVPPPDLLKAIEEARKRGVEITLFTNSMHNTDVELAFAAYEKLRPQLLEDGLTIYERQIPGIPLHAKSIIVDDSEVFLSTHNLDYRSFINSESGTQVRDPQLARKLREQILRDHLAVSTRVTSETAVRPRTCRNLIINGLARLLKTML